jgi:hypothetical protein
MPAQAGIQFFFWTPAFAGVTNKVQVFVLYGQNKNRPNIDYRARVIKDL